MKRLVVLEKDASHVARPLQMILPSICGGNGWIAGVIAVTIVC